MITRSTSLVPTDRPARYGKQLVSHLSRRHGGEWEDDAGRGWILLGDGGRAEAVVTDAGLWLELVCQDDALETLENVVASHLVRFGAKDELQVTWARTAQE